MTIQFSVVIPLYNKAAFIEGALRSVLAQELQPMEIIVVDDGSSDGGGFIVESLKLPLVRVIHQSNAGVSAARNRGLAEIKGDWVTFLDADDWQHPRFLRQIVDAHLDCPEADLIGTTYRCVEAPSKAYLWEPDTEEAFERIDNLYRRWMTGPCFCTSSVAMRTSTLRGLLPQFEFGVSHGEDLDVFLRMSDHAPVMLVREQLVSHRCNVPGSLTASTPKAYPPFVQRMRKARRGCVRAKEKRRFVADFDIIQARELLAIGARATAMRSLMLAYPMFFGLRWQLTAVLMLLPGALSDRWQKWRVAALQELPPAPVPAPTQVAPASARTKVEVAL